MARKNDHEYKVQAVKLAKEIGSAKVANELGIPKGTMDRSECIMLCCSGGRKEYIFPVNVPYTALWIR